MIEHLTSERPSTFSWRIHWAIPLARKSSVQAFWSVLETWCWSSCYQIQLAITDFTS